MAAIAHLGVGLAAKPLAPEINVGWLVLGNCVLDLLTHPMTAVAPDDTGLPLAFGDSPLIGLGLYRSIAAVWITEIGAVVVGLVIYILWRMRRRRLQAMDQPA